MGWASGSGLLTDVMKALGPLLSDDGRTREALTKIVAAFEDKDCDTLDECKGLHPVLDEVLRDRGWLESNT